MIARGGAESPYKEYWKAAQRLYHRFPHSFWRRLTGLAPAFRTKPRTRCFTRSCSDSDASVRRRVIARTRAALSCEGWSFTIELMQALCRAMQIRRKIKTV